MSIEHVCSTESLIKVFAHCILFCFVLLTYVYYKIYNLTIILQLTSYPSSLLLLLLLLLLSCGRSRTNICNCTTYWQRQSLVYIYIIIQNLAMNYMVYNIYIYIILVGKGNDRKKVFIILLKNLYRRSFKTLEWYFLWNLIFFCPIVSNQRSKYVHRTSSFLKG